MIQGDFKAKLKEKRAHKQESIHMTVPDVELKVSENWMNAITTLYNEMLGKIMM